jgi:hypothetical protein
MKGIADFISKDGVCVLHTEVHWYQCDNNIGKVEFKVKEEEKPQ